MPPIFINTNNDDKKNKIYIANQAGESSATVEEKIKAKVEAAFKDSSDFTTEKYKGAKGNTLVFTLSTYKVSGGDTTCRIVGDIYRYPGGHSKKHGKGVEKVMFSGEWGSTATASGRSGLSDAVDAIMDLLLPKAIPVMKSDMARR